MTGSPESRLSPQANNRVVMDSRVWQRYVAVACSQAWSLDIRATEELVQCIEALLAATPTADGATAHVLLAGGIGEIGVAGRGEDLKINIRLQLPRTAPAPGGRDPMAEEETVE